MRQQRIVAIETCIVCGKEVEIPVEVGKQIHYALPPAPWFWVSITKYESLGETSWREGNVCSPPCVRTFYEKAMEEWTTP